MDADRPTSLGRGLQIVLDIHQQHHRPIEFRVLLSKAMPAKNAKNIIKLVSAPRRVISSARLRRNFHNSSLHLATPLPVGVVGPPPNPPLPAAPQYGERIERRRKQAQMLQQAKELRSSQSSKGKQSPLKKRFWKDVDVKETPSNFFPVPSTLHSRQLTSQHRWLPNLP